MSNKLFGLLVATAIIFPVTVASSALFIKTAPQTPGAEYHEHQKSAGLMDKHRHHHCHASISLGHVKRKCHTHSHNKVVHHGPQFH